MEKVVQKRRGRPLIGDKALIRQELLIHPDVKEAAATEAAASGRTIAEVYRAWIDAGRKRRGR
jgi:hypothetical protein